MRKIVPALAVGFIAALGASSGAQAAVSRIDFSANAECPTLCTGISYTGATLGTSTAVDLDGSTWDVTSVASFDMSGLAKVDPIVITPTSSTYGSISGSGLDIPLGTDIVKTWDGAFGPFTETLTTLTEVDRGTNAISFFLSGTVTGGVFHDSPATMIFSLNQAGGPGNVVSASLTNSASTIPEASTWAMMLLGFIGLGYAAVRRSAKDRSAIAI